MLRTRVKICGITCVQDALSAAAAGADAIGLVFHPPVKRNISIGIAKQILSDLPPFVTPVALFVDVSADHIRSTCAQLNIRHVQLNGNESPEYLAELSGFTILKALKVIPGEFAQTLAN